MRRSWRRVTLRDLCRCAFPVCTFRVWAFPFALVLSLTPPVGSAQDFPLANHNPAVVAPHADSSSEYLKSMMVEAWKVNGLGGGDSLPPWHLKVSFQVLDPKGAVLDQGTYEEFWVSATQYKRTYRSSMFVQTDYGTEKGILRTGEAKWPPYLLQQIRHAFVNPLPDQAALGEERLMSEKHPGSQGGMLCIRKLNRPSDSTGHPTLSTYCFAGDTHRLAMSLTGIDNGQVFPLFRITRLQSASFQGHFIPNDMQVGVNIGLKPSLSAHLELLEPIGTVHQADFLPPAAAMPPPDSSQVDAGIVSIAPPSALGISPPASGGATAISPTAAAALLLKKVDPDYPPTALSAKVSGTVLIAATIGKDGSVSEARVVSGQLPLQQAALDAVKQYVYKPYLLNGSPVEFRTLIPVLFQLPKPEAP